MTLERDELENATFQVVLLCEVLTCGLEVRVPVSIKKFGHTLFVSDPADGFTD
jgi:hypothetical protein